MTRIKYTGRKPYRVTYKGTSTILHRGDIIDVPLGKIKRVKMRSFENLDEKERRDKDLNDKIKKIQEARK